MWLDPRMAASLAGDVVGCHVLLLGRQLQVVLEATLAKKLQARHMLALLQGSPVQAAL